MEAGRSVEFPYVDRRRTARRYRKVTRLTFERSAPRDHPMLNTLGRLDIETGDLIT